MVGRTVIVTSARPPLQTRKEKVGNQKNIVSSLSLNFFLLFPNFSSDISVDSPQLFGGDVTPEEEDEKNTCCNHSRTQIKKRSEWNFNQTRAYRFFSLLFVYIEEEKDQDRSSCHLYILAP
jgi:hypothetical protein